MECLRLRVKDVDFEMRQIVVRDGKGEKERVTMLPESAIEPLRAHPVGVRQVYDADVQKGGARVYLPYALERKYPEANR